MFTMYDEMHVVKVFIVFIIKVKDRMLEKSFFMYVNQIKADLGYLGHLDRLFVLWKLFLNTISTAYF